MNKLLLNCDQVFDALTRGPFPAGLPEDAAVERHLAACHECRQLAEALRPAVEVLHEAVKSDESSRLPAYRGVLVAASARQKPSNRNRPRSVKKVDSRLPAASLAGVALGILLCYVVMTTESPAAKNQQAALFTPTTTEVSLAVSPSDQGLLTLASLKLPAACLPLTHRPLSADQASEMIAAMADGSLAALRCCTDCHHAGGEQMKSARMIALAKESCVACHQG